MPLIVTRRGGGCLRYVGRYRCMYCSAWIASIYLRPRAHTYIHVVAITCQWRQDAEPTPADQGVQTRRSPGVGGGGVRVSRLESEFLLRCPWIYHVARFDTYAVPRSSIFSMVTILGPRRGACPEKVCIPPPRLAGCVLRSMV